MKAYVQYLKQSLIPIEGTRRVRFTFIARASNTSKTSKSLFYRATSFYNSLPNNIKLLEPKIFNKRIKNIVVNTYSPDRLPG